MKTVSQIFGLCLEEISGFSKDIIEFDNIYHKQLSLGKSINDSIKKMQEAKSKEAGEIVFRDILRILNNRKARSRELTGVLGQQTQNSSGNSAFAATGGPHED